MAKESSISSSIWVQRGLGLDLSKNLESVTHADVAYLCNHIYPFLQLVNVNAVFDENNAIKFIQAATGWTIHDYGDAISVAALHGVVNNGEEDTAGKVSSGGMVAQMATVSEVANLIAQKGWNTFEVVAGTPMMQRLLWIESKAYGFVLNGYTPGADDEKCYERLVKQAKANGLSLEKHASAPSIEK